jgi:hypothetical protein
VLVTYFRSSSYTCWDFCAHKFFLSYTLGMKEPSGKKATLGNMVHKALELLARKKLALQEGEKTFSDPETKVTFVTDRFDPEQAIEIGHGYYSNKETHHEWFPRDFRQVKQWMYDAMEMNGGMWNPLNRTVIAPEQYFDMEIDQPWAKYAYTLPDGNRLEGKLAIKGTVDLVTKLDENTLEYIDWKTGMRKDWASGKPKEWTDLRDDPQMRMYHYALTKLYPNVKNIIVTVVFIQDGGPFTLDFGKEDLPKTEQMLRERFELVRDCERPTRIIHDRQHKWKCARLCHFGKTKTENGRTICDHIHAELITLGMGRVTKKYAKAGAFDSYGDGGGRCGESTGR